MTRISRTDISGLHSSQTCRPDTPNAISSSLYGSYVKEWVDMTVCYIVFYEYRKLMPEFIFVYRLKVHCQPSDIGSGNEIDPYFITKLLAGVGCEKPRIKWCAIRKVFF